MKPELRDRRNLADSEYSNLERIYPECQQRILLMRLTWDSWAPTSKGDHGNLQLLRGKWPTRWYSPVLWYEKGHRGAGMPKLEPPLRAWWVTLSMNGSRLAMGCVRRWAEDRWRSGPQVSAWPRSALLKHKLSECGRSCLLRWWAFGSQWPEAEYLGPRASWHVCSETWVSTYSVHLVRDSVLILNHASHWTPLTFLLQDLLTPDAELAKCLLFFFSCQKVEVLFSLKADNRI